MAYFAECPNCKEPFLRKGQDLYCSLACAQTAELIRYARRKRIEGTFNRADIADAIASRLSQIIINGGYDKKAREVPEELRTKIFAKAEGKCQKCGKRFESEGEYRPTIQHCKGASNDEAHLQAWCWRCNTNHSISIPVAITPEQAQIKADIISRWEAQKPLQPCDDQELWPKIWRKFPIRLSEDQHEEGDEDSEDYLESCGEYATGSEDGDIYFAHAMNKD